MITFPSPQVAEMLGLTAGEIEDHFSGNAKRFLSEVRARQQWR